MLDKRMIGLTFAILDTRISDAEGEDKARLVCLREETLSAFARHGIFGGKGYPVEHISKNFHKLSSLILQKVEALATSRKYKSKLERELVAQLMHLELSRMGKILEELKQPNKDHSCCRYHHHHHQRVSGGGRGGETNSSSRCTGAERPIPPRGTDAVQGPSPSVPRKISSAPNY
ncbi:polyprotein [Frankliniella fusca]|uniref:Polyprotein n=1 Tax=Frankliniella fusca TaxID=407009 RepID=A0AAE1H261_9NEOP|nr:polyprotein [Frankliniella fusca]